MTITSIDILDFPPLTNVVMQGKLIAVAYTLCTY